MIMEQIDSKKKIQYGCSDVGMFPPSDELMTTPASPLAVYGAFY